MLKIEDISKGFSGKELFSDLSFNINKKERIGLVGRNGSGKTTLFKIILGELEPDAGEVHIPKYYTMGCVSQHIHFTKNSVLEEAVLGLRKEERYESWKARKILMGLGFTEEDLDKSPVVFSGGFQVRLNLAKALLSNPDLLLLDEPNNYLDIVAIRWLESFLKSWKNELMLITHDRQFMDSVITHTIAIHRKKAKKIQGTTGKIYSQISMEEENYEKTRVNEEKKRKQTELFITRFRAKARLGGMVQSRVKTLEKQEIKEKLEGIEMLDFKFSYSSFPSAQMMSLNDVSFSYDDTKEYLIKNFSIDIGKNDKIAIIGKNGKGKSTLLKLFSGKNIPKQGDIKKHSKLKIGYFSQTNIESLNSHNNILEEIMSVDIEITLQKARDVAGTLMFKGDDALKKISVLSGGEKNRVAFGKILATPCNLLLLDEPTNHLDLESCDALLSAIKSFEGSIIMVTHNEMYLNEFAEKLIVFDKDETILYNRTYQGFLEDIGWEDEVINYKKNKKEKRRNKKEIRKLKLEAMKEQSNKLKNEKEEMNLIEEKIIKYEEEKKDLEKELIEASINKDAPEIARLSKKIYELKLLIDKVFKEIK